MNDEIARILAPFGSDADLAKMIGARPHVCRDWKRRGSIPLSHWPSLYELGVTADQLLKAHNAAESNA